MDALAAEPRRDTLAAMPGRDNGFDTVRLLAAIAVLVSHAFALTGFREPLEEVGPRFTLGLVAVAVFFVTSGLLITMSADRRAPTQFLSQRARRLMPGLIACVLVCVAIGALVSSLPPAGYLQSPTTWQFAGNAAFLPVTFSLPGVFESQPVAAVNGSLWTLKFEVACYAGSFAFAYLTRARLALLLLLWAGSLIGSRVLTGDEGGVLFYVYWFAFLFRFYGAGMILYALRDRIPLRADAALASFLLVCLSPALELFPEAAATLGAYALVVAAYRAPRWFRRVTSKGDISYGVYLYAYPIQQLVVPIALGTAVPWLTNIALALPLTLLAGAISWLVVERSFMRKREERVAAAHAF